jgi:hypothetical protein
MDEIEKILEELKMEHNIEELVSFNDINIQEKIKDNSFLVMKYKELWIKEKVALEELEDKLNILISSRYNHYRFEMDEKLTKQEIEKYYIPGDKKIIQMNKILRKQKVKVDFFEMAWKGLEKMQWNLKVFADGERRGY